MKQRKRVKHQAVARQARVAAAAQRWCKANLRARLAGAWGGVRIIDPGPANARATSAILRGMTLSQRVGLSKVPAINPFDCDQLVELEAA